MERTPELRRGALRAVGGCLGGCHLPLVGTIIAVYGFGLMTPIGWKWGLGMWAYALTWFVFNDAVKVAVLRYFRRHHKKVMV